MIKIVAESTFKVNAFLSEAFINKTHLNQI